MKTISFKPLASWKALFTKVAIAGALAGAVFFATPKQADAQVSVQFGFGRSYNGPAYRPYYTPPVYGPAFYAERRHEEWLRHERWEREHRFYGPVYGYRR